MAEKGNISGAVSQLLLGVFAFLAIVQNLLGLSFTVFISLGVGLYAILLVSAVLFMFYTRRASLSLKRDPMGTLGTIFGTFTALAGLFLCVVAYSAVNGVLWTTYFYFSEYLYVPNPTGQFLIMAIDFLLGCTMVSIGLFLVDGRSALLLDSFWPATGTVYIVGGILFLLMTVLAYAVAIAAGIMGAVCLLVSKPRK